MALTQFEKDCIAEIVAPMTGRRAPNKLTEEQETTLQTATQGTEAERKTMVTDHITNEGLDAVAAEIEGCDTQTAAVAAHKTVLETKLAAMQAYVA